MHGINRAGRLGHDRHHRLGLGAAAQRHFERHRLEREGGDPHRLGRSLGAGGLFLALGDGQHRVGTLVVLLGLEQAGRLERSGHRAAVLAVDRLDDRHLALARTLAGNDQRAGREPRAQHEDDDQG